MGNKKTNIEHLRDLINDHVGEKHKDECLEFLEEIENEYEKMSDEVKTAESRADDAESELKNVQDELECSCEINTRLGPNDNIRYEAGNLNAQSMMEALKETIERGIPMLKVENAIRAL
jgi:cell division septum initiation protein DivIVA